MTQTNLLRTSLRFQLVSNASRLNVTSIACNSSQFSENISVNLFGPNNSYLYFESITHSLNTEYFTKREWRQKFILYIFSTEADARS